MRVVVADDEPLAREAVTARLADEPDVEIVAECQSGDEALFAIQHYRPDVLFLDIRMPELDGFDVLRRTTLAPVVVFVTAHPDFALSAFDVAATDYLLKPINDARFRTTLDRVRNCLASNERGGEYLQRFVSQTGSRSTIVGVEDVEWIESADYYARLHLADGRTHLVRESMKTLIKLLDPLRFARIHRCAIVRLDAIMQLRHSKNASVILRSGTSVRMSHSGRKVLRSRLRQRGALSG